MSDEERDLLAAIIEAPDDDAPRLVYADWLQSRDDPRGELIQLQCRLAAAPDDERRRAIRIAENKLLAAHAKTWVEPLLALLPTPVFPSYSFDFVRGFVEDATITLDALPRLGDLLAAAPLLRRLRVVGNGFLTTPIEKPRLDGALAAPGFRRLRRLELKLAGGGNELAEEVAGAETLRDLRELAISSSVWGEQIAFYGKPAEELVLDDTGAAALAASPHLANVTHLDLDSNRIGVPGVHAIARGAWRLRELLLSHNSIDAVSPRRRGSPFVASLAGPALASLEVLGLAGVPFGPQDIAALVASPTLASLRELDLERCHLGVEGVTALCEAFALPALRRLRVERNNLCDAGAHVIAGCAALADLTSFEAGHNRIGRKGGIALATTPHFKNLERLLLNEPRWKPDMTAVFASSPTLVNAKTYLAGRLVSRKRAKPPIEEAGDSPAPKATKKSRARSS